MYGTVNSRTCTDIAIIDVTSENMNQKVWKNGNPEKVCIFDHWNQNLTYQWVCLNKGLQMWTGSVQEVNREWIGSELEVNQ